MQTCLKASRSHALADQTCESTVLPAARDAYVVGADGLMTPVGGRSTGQEMQLMEPDPLESWVDNVVDWYEFEDEGSVLGGTDALDPDSLPWKVRCMV